MGSGESKMQQDYERAVKYMAHMAAQSNFVSPKELPTSTRFAIIKRIMNHDYGGAIITWSHAEKDQKKPAKCLETEKQK